MKKTRLEPHPDEAPVVRKMFAWRVGEQLSYQAIADRLNADLAFNPPSVPVDPERSVGRWTYSNVRDVLTNPKHIRHMVWNRRARKGAGKTRMNPVSEWVWSPEPVWSAHVRQHQTRARFLCMRPQEGIPAPGHPVILRVREDHLLSGLTRFLASDVFGPYRHKLLDASHAALAQAAHEEHVGKIKALERPSPTPTLGWNSIPATACEGRTRRR